jgi:hypothetical protein
MSIRNICRKIAGPCTWICLLFICGLVGGIENGGSLSLAWFAFAALGLLGLVYLGASGGDNNAE